jgi:hypothetical protein
MAYLRSVLSQDVGAFDTDLTTANIMAGATNHMKVIQDAIGEKVSVCISRHSLYVAVIQTEAQKLCSIITNCTVNMDLLFFLRWVTLSPISPHSWLQSLLLLCAVGRWV